VSIAAEIFTSKFILYDDDDDTFTTLQPKEEYLLKSKVEEPQFHEVEMLMK